MEKLTVLALITLTVLGAQTLAAAPRFEVAAIKPVPLGPGVLAARLSGGATIGMKIEGQHVRIGLTSSRKLIEQAWDVRPYQIVMPRQAQLPLFDIDALLPEGATAAQVPQMLQTLLAERFHLETSSKEMAIDAWALTVAEGGPKLTTKEAPPETPGVVDKTTTMAENGDGAVISNADATQTFGKGLRRIQTSTVAGLAATLTMRLPVVDETGLSGEYDIRLAIPVAPSLATGGGDLRQRLEDAAEENEHSVIDAVQKLGLKLIRRKVTVKTIVVDHVDLEPTDN
jgi:uncharacterized protein (TIGR03435 family)